MQAMREKLAASGGGGPNGDGEELVSLPPAPATSLQPTLADTTPVPTGLEDPLLSTGEAADMLGISVATVRKWLVAGLLIGGWMGGRFKVRKSCVDQQLRAMANSIKVG